MSKKRSHRAKVWDPRKGHPVNVGTILGGSSQFATKKERDAAIAEAKKQLGTAGPSTVTVEAFVRRWTTDPLFARPKESTNLHNAERVRAFAQRYGSRPMMQIGDGIVGEWLAGGKNLSTVPALRAMFNDAMSAKAGRVTRTNPFVGLGLRKSRGNRDKNPPTEEVVWSLIAAARAWAGPSFAAWLQVGAFTGLRHGELDALRWASVDFEKSRIAVVEQYNARSKSFTLPKNGLKRVAPLTPPARDALLSLPRSESEFCFVNLAGNHWTYSARSYYWKSVRASTGYTDTLYLATRHHAGWYMRNVLGLDAEDIAVALGHTDGGELVRVLYGHLDRELALERVQRAYEGMANVHPLKVVGDDRDPA